MSGSGFAQFIPLILIFVIFYFFLIRPQQKKVKEHKLMVSALKRGDEVVTSGGIVGKIERVLGDDKVDILISENVTVRIIPAIPGKVNVASKTVKIPIKSIRLIINARSAMIPNFLYLYNM